LKTAAEATRPYRISARLVKRTGAGTSRSPVKLFQANRAGADKATRPGRYTLRLIRGRGRALRSDTVMLSAVYATPLVSVHTITGGKPGIQVAGTTFPANVPGGGPAAFVQVVVLDRLTLALDSNTTYTNTDQLAQSLSSKALDDSKLVLVAMPQPAAGAQPLAGRTSLLAALAPIGVANGDVGSGSVSAIGVPGLSAGNANVSVDPHGDGMDGYLTPDQNLEYSFISPERQAFNFTERQPGCPDVDPGVNDVGFKVSLIDPYNLTCAVKIFPTNGIGLTDAQRDQMARDMGSYIIAAPAGYLVRIEPTRTINDLSRPLIGAIQTDTAANLANIVAAVGGTKNGFNTAAFYPAPDGFQQYALMGWKGAGEGNGEEVALGVDRITDASSFSGILRRDRTYRFRPVQMNTAGDVNQTLQNLILQPPKPGWPLDDKPGPNAALSYISETSDNRLGCDPRNAYWTRPLTEADLNEILGTVRAAKPPSADATDPCTNAQVNFTSSDFTTAQGQLVQELKWLSRVRSYMQLLASPFADGGIKSWAAVSDVAATVYSTSRQPDGDVSLFWSQILLPDPQGPGAGHRRRQRAGGRRPEPRHVDRRKGGRRVARRRELLRRDQPARRAARGAGPAGPGHLRGDGRHHRQRLQQAQSRGQERRLRPDRAGLRQGLLLPGRGEEGVVRRRVPLGRAPGVREAAAARLPRVPAGDGRGQRPGPQPPTGPETVPVQRDLLPLVLLSVAARLDVAAAGLRPGEPQQQLPDLRAIGAAGRQHLPRHAPRRDDAHAHVRPGVEIVGGRRRRPGHLAREPDARRAALRLDRQRPRRRLVRVPGLTAASR
jgi:hypothetical protein